MAHKPKIEKSINFKIGDLVLHYSQAMLDEYEDEYIMGFIHSYTDDNNINIVFLEEGTEHKLPFNKEAVILYRQNFLDFLKDPDNKKVVDF